jgi:signal transduction histidine kinase
MPWSRHSPLVCRPMNAILACSQLLTDMPSLTEEQRELSQMIQGSGQQLLSLINDILDFSKVSCTFFIKILINQQNDVASKVYDSKSVRLVTLKMGVFDNAY